MSEKRQRTAVVLGGASHIGRGVVKRYSDSGYEVIAVVRGKDTSEIRGLPGVRTLACDLADPTQVAELLAINHELVQADALVLLAADVQPSVLSEAGAETYTRALNVGAVAGFLFLGTLGPAMADRGYGRVVVGSSIGVRFGGGFDSFTYSLSKHLSEFIPREARNWAHRGVLHNVIRIGVTDTSAHSAFPSKDLAERVKLIPLGRPASVDEVADFLFWYGSELNTFVTGQVIAISGGE